MCPALLEGIPGTPEAKEARLDLHVWLQGAQGPEEAWIDVSHTHPAGSKVRTKAASEERAAAKVAEDRKAKRYGDGAGGVFVYPFVVESWGGLGGNAYEGHPGPTRQGILLRDAC